MREIDIAGNIRTVWVLWIMTALSPVSCETRILGFKLFQLPSTADLASTVPRKITRLPSAASDRLAESSELEESEESSTGRTERRSETLTEGASRSLRMAEALAVKLRMERIAAYATAAPSTAPSNERARFDRRDITACSCEDMSRSHLRLLRIWSEKSYVVDRRL